MALDIGGGKQDFRTTAARIRKSQQTSSVSAPRASSGFRPTYYYRSSGGSSTGGGGSSSAAPRPSQRQRNLRRRGRSVSYHGPRADRPRGWGVRVRIGRLSDGTYGVERWTAGGTRQTPSWS